MPLSVPLLAQDEMLPAPQMKELYELHPREPWCIVYFPGEVLALAAACLCTAPWRALTVRHSCAKCPPQLAVP